MAQSKSFFDDVKKELECSVCQELFSEVNEPKILKCLHTFCKNCLEAWLRMQREGQLSCPTCRQITECPNRNIYSLPSNLFYKQMVEIVEAYSGTGQEDDSLYCGNCEEKKHLKFYCFDCNTFLCDECAGTHSKWKSFKGHHVKEIGKFESSDVQDYARKSNVCKKHKDELRFYCENCNICICRDCAILEHRDDKNHNIVSLEQGFENKKLDITSKMQDVEAIATRLRDQKQTLEKKRVRMLGSIDQAISEIHLVAEQWIRFIRQNESAMTKKLLEHKNSFQEKFSVQMSSLDEKIVEIDNSLVFSSDVLARENLLEILNVEEILDKRFQDLSLEFQVNLNYPYVKYIPNDASSPVNDVLGELIFTNSLLTTANGKGLTEEEQQSLVQKAEQPESDDEASITIVVSGDLPSEDALLNYFENARRSGGGEVLNMDYNDEGDVAITFAEVKDLKRLREGPHTIDEKPLKVINQPPKKKVPLDPLKVHVQGLNDETGRDSLRLYLEKFSKVDVTEVYMGCNNNAMAVFNAEPDFAVLFYKVTNDRIGLEGKHVRLDRVPICSCIKVKGLRTETSCDAIEIYFENSRRSGGGHVSHVERIEKDQVLVYFENPSSVETVIKRSHVLEREQLDVEPYYPFLENSSTNKTDIAFEAEVYDYVKKYHQRELQAVLEEQEVLVEISDDSQSSTITIFPSEKKKKESLQSWQKRVSGLETFLNSFKKIEVPIGAELFDEMVQRWKKQHEVNLRQGGSPHFEVSFNKQSFRVQIIGREKDVAEEEIRLKQSIVFAYKDTELMKSIVEVEMTDISESRLALLKMCDIGGRLQNKHQHLDISIDLKGNKVHLKGPRSVLLDVQLEIYKFSSNVTEESLELPATVIAVLKNPTVLDFMTGLLKEKAIQALFIYDQKKSSNEVLVVGAGSNSVRDAGKVLQNVIQKRNLKLTYENTLVLESHQWKAFLSNLTSTKKIGIFTDHYSSTLWICGIAEDVQFCVDSVEQFLVENTILPDTFHIDQGKERWNGRGTRPMRRKAQRN